MYTVGTLPQCFSAFPVGILCWSRYCRKIAMTARAVDMLVWQARAVATDNIFPRPEFFWKTLFLCSKHVKILTKFRFFCLNLFLLMYEIRETKTMLKFPANIERQWKIGHEFFPYMGWLRWCISGLSRHFLASFVYSQEESKSCEKWSGQFRRFVKR